jgi:hypothetical protein
VSDRRRPLIVITPRVGGILGCLAAATIAYIAIAGVDQGRSTVRAHWALAVTAGAGTSSGVIALLAASVAATRWRQQAPRALGLPMAWLSGATLLITVAGWRIVGDGSVVTTPWEVGLAAFMVPVACLALVLIPWLTWRKRAPEQAPAAPEVRSLIVATITARGDCWPVRWTGMGQTPRPRHAATLTAAAGQALTAASALQARNTTELRIMIYPGPYRGGPTFDITGEPGDLTATISQDPGEMFHRGTLEDLADAIYRTRIDARKDFRLRWTQPITAQVAPAALPEQQLPGDRLPRAIRHRRAG